MRFGLALAIGMAIIASCAPDEPIVEAMTADDEPSTTTAELSPADATATDSDATTAATECNRGAVSDNAGFEEDLARVVALYEQGQHAELADLIGEGIVHDPALDPAGEPAGTFASIEDWVARARELDDRLELVGFSPGEPVMLFVSRTSDGLADVGIDELAITIELWLGPACDVRVRVTDPISAPDPCRFNEVAELDPVAGCAGSFEPRFSHLAVWTGSELLIHGGASATTEAPPLQTGLAFDPAQGSWREIAEAPTALRAWPPLAGGWTGTEMVVVGSDLDGDVVVLRYDPTNDAWSESVPLPAERYGTGAVVVTPSEVLLVGGSWNDPRDDGWSFELATESWTQLPESTMVDTEGAVGIWTGTEAIFIGGHPASQTLAFDPATREWSEREPYPDGWIQEHELVWTGSDVIVVGGHIGPDHQSTLARYDPAADAWAFSSEMPIAARERTPAAWTGSEVVFWSGFSTYGQGMSPSGASYDPATDSWTELPPSPLTPRCQHSGTWTDAGFIVFGGLPRCGDPGVLATGTAAAFDPLSGTWTELVRS